jgi:hypothetical protein
MDAVAQPFDTSTANNDFTVQAGIVSAPSGVTQTAILTLAEVTIDGAVVNLSDARAWAAATGSSDPDPWTAAAYASALPPAAFKPRPERVSVWVRMDPSAVSPGPTDGAGGDARDAQWLPSNTGAKNARWGVHVALHDDPWPAAGSSSPAAASAPPAFVFAADAAAALGRECAARRMSLLRTYARAAALESAGNAAADAALAYFFQQGGLNVTAFSTAWVSGGGAVLGAGDVLANANFPPGGWLFGNVSILGNASFSVNTSVTSSANAGPTWAVTEGSGGATGAGGLAPALPALPWALLRGGGARLDAAAGAGASPLSPTDATLAVPGLAGAPATERGAWASRDAFGFSAASAAVAAARAGGGGMPGTGYRLRGEENDGFDALPDVTGLGADGFPSLAAQTLSRQVRAAAAARGGVVDGPTGAMVVDDGDAWAGFRVSDAPSGLDAATPAIGLLATAPLGGGSANTLYGDAGGGLFTAASGRTLFAAAEAALVDSGAPRDSAVARLTALVAALAAPASLPVATGGAGAGGPGVDPSLEATRGPAFPLNADLPAAPSSAPWEAFGISARDVEAACGPPTDAAPPPPPPQPQPTQNATAADARVMVGVGVVGGAWAHGANYRGAPGLALGARGASAASAPPRARYAQADRWYKLDIFLDWANATYSVRLDDTTLALAQPFAGDGVTRVGLYVFDSTTAYFDELFVGSDDTLGFECPVATGEAQALRTRRPLQTGWSTEDVGPESAQWGMREHVSSHLARRERYSPPSKSGLVALDGMPHRAFHADTLARRDAEGAAFDALYPEAGALSGSDAYEGGVGRGGGTTMVAPGPVRMSSAPVAGGAREASSSAWTLPTVDPDTGALPGDPVLGQSSAARWQASRDALRALSSASLAAAPQSDAAALASRDFLAGAPPIGAGRMSELESPDGTLDAGDMLAGALLWDSGDAPTEELLEAAQTVSAALEGSRANANYASAAWGRGAPFGDARLPPDVAAAHPGLNSNGVVVPGGATPVDRLARALWIAAILEGGGYDAAVRALAAGGRLGVGSIPAGAAGVAGESRGGEAVSPGGVTEGWGLRGGYGGATGRAYWFGEHDNPRHADFLAPGTRLSDAPAWPLIELRPWRRGGVGACSASGLSGAPWRNDGIVFRFSNITVPADIVASTYAAAGFPNMTAPLGRAPFALRADGNALMNASNVSYWDPVTNSIVEDTSLSTLFDNAAGALDDDGLPPRIVGAADPSGDDDAYGGGVRDRSSRAPRSTAPPPAFPFRLERPKVVRRAALGEKPVFVMWAAVEQFFDWPMDAPACLPFTQADADSRALLAIDASVSSGWQGQGRLGGCDSCPCDTLPWLKVKLARPSEIATVSLTVGASGSDAWEHGGALAARALHDSVSNMDGWTIALMDAADTVVASIRVAAADGADGVWSWNTTAADLGCVPFTSTNSTVFCNVSSLLLFKTNYSASCPGRSRVNMMPVILDFSANSPNATNAALSSAGASASASSTIVGSSGCLTGPDAQPVASSFDSRFAPPTMTPTPTPGPPVDGIPRPADLRGSIFSKSAIDLGFYNVSADIASSFGEVNITLVAPPMHVPARPPIRLRLAGVAVSHNIAGPYTWVWSVRPDGNETVDLTVVQTPLAEGERGPPPAFLARTYYSTEAYVLPRPVLQPLWESVKFWPSADANETDINFALNYHRAVYHANYDLPDDMIKQQWRMEDKAWSIQSAKWRETYNQTYPALPDNAASVTPSQSFSLVRMRPVVDANGNPVLRPVVDANGDPVVDANGNPVPNPFDQPTYEVDPNFAAITYEPKERAAALLVYLSAEDRKELFKDDANALAQVWDYKGLAPHIMGQGLRPDEVRSRFMDPSAIPGMGGSPWKPESVPAVKAQSWSDNYWEKNIADNPVIPALPDLLIGERMVIQKRRTKFVALSRLSDDYLSTTGAVTTLEGETTRGDALLAVLAQAGLGVDAAADVAAGLRWAWDAGTGSGRNTTAQPDVTTFAPHPASEIGGRAINFPTVFDTETDWRDRHWQFLTMPNDRELDFRNFRDRQFSGDNACPDIHHKHLINYQRCFELYTQIAVKDSEPVRNSKGEMQSFFQGVDTQAFEECLAKSRLLLVRYAACLHNKPATGTMNASIAAQAAVRNITNTTAMFGFAKYAEPDADREVDLTKIANDGIFSRNELFSMALLPSYYGFPKFGFVGRDGNPIPIVRRRALQGDKPEARALGSEAEQTEREARTFRSEAEQMEDAELSDQERELMRVMGV